MSNRGLDSRFTLSALDQQAAQMLGHVAWIESDDAAHALREMVRAVRTAPFNVAIWADAGKSIDPVLLQNLAAWREQYSPKSYYFDKKSTSQQEARQQLRDQFAKAGPAGNHDTGSRLEDHMANRLSQIFAALQPTIIQSVFGLSESTKPVMNAHIDNNGSRRSNKVRLLEALACPTTFLFDNQDVIQDPYSAAWGVKEDGPITIWQTPANSLLLITDASLAWTPILHASPVTLRGQTPQKRTVNIYDFGL